MQTLLLADDSVTIQRVIELTFADEDINVVAVSDGDQAIARLDAMPPDILLVDVGMPGRSGYDVAEHVKQTPHLSHIPVVLLTGAFEPVDQDKADALGCDGVLAKPFEPQIVISRVKELLAKPGTPADSQPTAELTASAAAATAEPAAELPLTADPPPQPEVVAKLDEYFDQLDSAFARFTSSPPVKPSDLLPDVVEDATPAALDWFGAPPTPPVGAEEAVPELAGSGPFAIGPTAPGLTLPDSADLMREVAELQPPPPDTYGTAAVVEPTAPVEPGETQAPAVSEEVKPLPPLADAFASVFATEHAATAASPTGSLNSLPAAASPTGSLNSLPNDPAAAPGWPGSQPAAVASAPEISDEVIDRIARRVVDQLTDRVVREAVADAVAGIAERLVREEIERIKKSIE